MRRRDILHGLASIPLAGALPGDNRSAATEVKQDSTAIADPLYNPKLHLFIDDHGVLRSQNVTRLPGRAKKHPVPVVRQDRPWESPWIYAWGSVFREPDGLFRMWYETMGHRGDICLNRLCYAESADGVEWRKPSLRRYTMDGYDQTNIVLMSSAIHGPGDTRGEQALQHANVKYTGPGQSIHELVNHVDGSNVVRDDNEPDPARRYKYLAAMWHKDLKGGWAHHLVTSPDGIDWTMPPREVLRVNDGTKLVWDSIRKLWMLTWLSSAVSAEGVNVRYLELAESRDLITWTQVGKPFELDEADGHGNIMQGHFLLPFAYGDQYVGIANMIHSQEGWAQGYLVSSRDGRRWDRHFRNTPFVTLGAEDDFDADSSEAALSPPILVGDELFIYYCGRARRHWAPVACTGAIGLLRLKRDRFAGLNNGGWFNREANNNRSDDAEVVTRPVKVTGPRLYVNVRSRQVHNPGIAGSELWGTLRTELLDEQEKPIPGYTLADSVPCRDDETRAMIRWKDRDTVADLEGRKVHVRFVFNMATIYAYQFA